MDETAIDLRAVLGVVRRQRWLILLIIVLVTALAGAATFAITPVYTAASLVLVDPSRKNLLDPETTYSTSMSDSARVDSEVELAKSDTVLLRVIDDLKLASNSEFSPRLGLRERAMVFLKLGSPILPTGQQALDEVLGSLRSVINAQRRGLTFLIAVQARSNSPGRAADLANAVARNYIQEQVDAKISSVMAAQTALETRLSQAAANISAADDAVDSFMSDNIARIEAESGDSTIGTLRDQIQQLEAERLRTQDTADIVTAQLAQRDWSNVSQSLASEALEDLQRQRNELEARIAEAGDTSTEGFDLRSQLAQVEQNLAQGSQQGLQDLQETIRQTDAQTEKLREQIRSAVVTANLPSELLTQFYGLQQRSQVARDQYQQLLVRSQDLAVQASLQLPDSRIVSPAIAPSTPSFPNTRSILLMAALAGLGIGLGLAFLYENFIGGFTSEQQAENVLRLPISAFVPRQKSKGTPADLIGEAPLSAYSESLRRIRVAIDQVRRSGEARKGATVIMVTSSVPEEGKTTLALSLARSYALARKSTLLIDGDLRKPNIHRLVDRQPDKGLAELLSAPKLELDQSSLLHRDTLSDTLMLLGARRSGIPTDQLVSDEGFGRLIEAARQAFDIVVIDTPPLVPVVDGLHIARMVDVAIFAVRWGSTPQQEAKRALRTLQIAAPATRVIPVVTQQDMSKAATQYRYGSYYVDPV
ncbi:hypothetical protein IC608_14995 [Devosia sp. PTR5]|uniref:Polysaccharide biosynthesis tyrosine autokinase n=1 Tax=Devosia oryzisoli TaxID=2774138 RepID=A0A927FX79_9HYPH|nr:hypothetical protein [Devosia oryzisoli]